MGKEVESEPSVGGTKQALFFYINFAIIVVDIYVL